VGNFRDVTEIGHYAKIFIVESWIEYLRQYERVTVTDRDLQDLVHAFHKGDIRPKVSHIIYADFLDILKYCTTSRCKSAPCCPHKQKAPDQHSDNIDTKTNE